MARQYAMQVEWSDGSGECGFNDLLGKRVRVHGLKARPELNDAVGRVYSFDHDKGRAGVHLDNGGPGLWVKPCNLLEVSDTPLQVSPELMERKTVGFAPGQAVSLAYRWHSAPSTTASVMPLVCLHGSLCDSSFYDALDAQLPGYRALCIDLPGHGASDRISDDAEASAPTELMAMATAVRNLLEALGVTRTEWALAGHSLGGTVALLLIELLASARGDERLPGSFTSFEGNATPACCATDGLARRVAAMPQPPSELEILQMVANEPVWHASAQRVGESVGRLAHRIFTSLVKWCDGSNKLDGICLEQMQRRVPLRYVYGAMSGKYHEANRAAHADHPNAEAAGVEGAGHFMLTDRPDDTVAALRRLLASGQPEPGQEMEHSM